MEVLKAMLIGNPGIGKTKVLGSAAGEARLGRSLLVDFEANTASIRSKLAPCTLEQLSDSKWLPSKEKINHIRITTLKEIAAIQQILEENDFNDPNGFQTLLLDSFGELAYKHLTKVTADNHRSNGKGNGIAPLIGDFGDSGAIMNREIRKFRDLPLHFICTCHSDEQRDGNTGITVVRPKLTGQLKAAVPGMLQFVAYIRSTPDDPLMREMVTQPFGGIECVKNAFEGSTLPPVFQYGANDPILTMILDGLGFEPLSTTTAEPVKKSRKMDAVGAAA